MGMSATAVIVANVGFFVFACAILVWAQWRSEPGPPFPGPGPVGTVFKAWLIVIWVVGLLMPLAALAIEWTPAVRLALLPYLATFVLQVATEIFVWKRWRSPVWVLVPCLYLPWRLFQSWLGIDMVDDGGTPVALITMLALFVLWAINIGVHYTNIVNTLRWSHHAADATFPALRSPNVFGKDA